MRIFHKLLVIITIPLGFMVLFIGTMSYFVQKTDRAIESQLHLQEILAKMHELVVKADESSFLLSEYGIEQDRRILDEYDENAKSTTLILTGLKTLFKDDSNRLAVVRELEEARGELSLMIVPLRQQKIKKVLAQEQLLIAAEAMRHFRTMERCTKELTADQERALQLVTAEQAFARTCISIVMGFAFVASIVFATALTYLFSRDFTKRIEILKINSLRLAFEEPRFDGDTTTDANATGGINTASDARASVSGDSAVSNTASGPASGVSSEFGAVSQQRLIESPLEAYVHGYDEIAELDKTFHMMASRLKETLDRERAIFENAVDIICSLDSSGRITRINGAFQRLLGFRKQDVLLAHVVNFVEEEHRATVYENLKSVKEDSEHHEVHQVEMRMTTASHHPLDVQWSVVWDAGHRQYFCVARDITEQKQLQARKQDFIAMLSHDLKSPLTSIRASFDMVLRGDFGPVPEKLISTVSKNKVSTDRLILLVNELLDLEKLESGQMELNIARVAPDDVIAAAVESIKTMAASQKLVIEESFTPQSAALRMLADKDRIIRVLVNLIANAIKYSPDGGQISIGAIERHGHVEVSVSDEGPGIPQAFVDSIFERYKQVSREDHTEKKGSGLGLAICKAILDAHQGSIGVHSEVGQGSTFWFRLPKA